MDSKKIMAFCEKHGEYEQTELFLGTMTIKSKCPKCAAEEEAAKNKEASEEEKKAREEKIELRLENAKIPLRFVNCGFNNYHRDEEGQERAYKAAKFYFDLFKSGRVSDPLFLTGSSGTGKTHLAIAILRNLIKKELIKSGKYVTTMRMIREIRSAYSYKSTENEQQIIDRYIYEDLLVLDEVGMQMGSDNEKILIYEVLNGRHENLKPTILISNLSYNDMTEYLGSRVVDRLKGRDGVAVAMNWESYRGKE